MTVSDIAHFSLAVCAVAAEEANDRARHPGATASGAHRTTSGHSLLLAENRERQSPLLAFSSPSLSIAKGRP